MHEPDIAQHSLQYPATAAYIDLRSAFAFMYTMQIQMNLYMVILGHTAKCPNTYIVCGRWNEHGTVYVLLIFPFNFDTHIYFLYII